MSVRLKSEEKLHTELQSKWVCLHSEALDIFDFRDRLRN